MKVLTPLNHVKTGDRIQDLDGVMFTVTAVEYVDSKVVLTFNQGSEIEFSSNEVVEVER